MKFYITYGTHSFLKTIVNKHKKKHDIYLLDGEGSSLLLVEKKGRSLFQSGKAYTIEYTSGSFETATFAVMNNMPVSQEFEEIFLLEARDRATLIKKQPGCTAVRVLNPVKKNTSFILLSMWDSHGDFRRFQASPNYEKQTISEPTLPHQLFTGKAYMKLYSIYCEEVE